MPAMSYAIIDVETTGTSSKSGKITEIAIILHDGIKEEFRFSSLVNPEMKVPPYITQLTGITQDMVENAPCFYEIAKKIIELTEGRVFVAHNAQFDYDFIRSEFLQLGYTFSRKKLCTVRLSRKLLPGFKSYSLGNLCKELSLKNQRPHRALEDALVTSELFEILNRKSQEMGIESLVHFESMGLGIPPLMEKEQIDYLPEATGIYKILDKRGSPLYIGKSKNIKRRILEHLKSNLTEKKDYSFIQSWSEIETIVTGSELIALLLENELIKSHKPIFNQSLKKTTFNWGIRIDPKNNDKLELLKLNDDESEALLKFSSKKTATEKYNDLASWTQLGKDFRDHPLLRFPTGRVVFLDKGRELDEKSFILVDNGDILGFGFGEILETWMFQDNISDNLEFTSLRDFPDSKSILLPFISQLKSIKIQSP